MRVSGNDCSHLSSSSSNDIFKFSEEVFIFSILMHYLASMSMKNLEQTDSSKIYTIKLIYKYILLTLNIYFFLI